VATASPNLISILRKRTIFGAIKVSRTYPTWMPTTIKLVLTVRFFRTTAGAEPVRDWLRELDAADRKLIGEDVKTVQIG